MVVTRPVDLTSLIDSMIAFPTAFGLEVLLFSSELWARLPVGVVLTVIVMLISWCVWTMLEAKSGFNVLVRVHALKEAFNRHLPRRPRAPTSATLPNPTGTNRYAPPITTMVEMGGVGNDLPESAV